MLRYGLQNLMTNKKMKKRKLWRLNIQSKLGTPEGLLRVPCLSTHLTDRDQPSSCFDHLLFRSVRKEPTSELEFHLSTCLPFEEARTDRKSVV